MPHTSVRKVFPKDVPTIIKLYKTMTLQEIGDRYGICRERVRQIIKNQGKKIEHNPEIYQVVQCVLCPKTFSVRKKGRRSSYCSLCRCYLYGRKHAKGKPYLRRFQIRPTCIECKKKPVISKNRCNSCTARLYYRTHPAYRQYVKEYHKKSWERKKMGVQ